MIPHRAFYSFPRIYFAYALCASLFMLNAGFPGITAVLLSIATTFLAITMIFFLLFVDPKKRTLQTTRASAPYGFAYRGAFGTEGANGLELKTSLKQYGPESTFSGKPTSF